MPEYVDDIIVVDDCSSDGTAEAALACADSRVVVLKTPTNHGVGGATILGYRKAMELQAAIAVKMDGDGQMPSEHLHSLLDALIEQGYDYAKGNRFLVSEALTFMPKHRLIGNIILTFFTKLASGYWQVFDPQNGYTAIRVEALRLLNLDAVHKRFFFENDMLVSLNIRQCRVKDVAMPARYADEESDINLMRIILTFPLLLVRRYLHRVYQRYVLRDFSPIALFLFAGSVLFGWGIIFGIYLWIKTAITATATPTGTIILALLPLILGFQLILEAIVLDIRETPT
jgi:glycosyltransferase involved in cell wall biosynthesis